MRDRPPSEVRNDRETVRAVNSVDAVDACAARIWTDQDDQGVCCVAYERYVYRTSEVEGRLGQSASERGDFGRVRIDPRDSPGRTFGNIQRTIRTNSAAKRTLQSGKLASQPWAPRVAAGRLAPILGSIQ